LERQRTQGEVKKESDEKIPAGMLDFRSAKLEQVLDIYGELVNRKVLRPSTLPVPTITLSPTTPLNKKEATQVLDSALALNGIAMVNVGDRFVKALPESQASTAGGRFDTNSAARLSDSGQYVTHVVQLEHTKPSDLLPVLQPLLKAPNSVLPIDSSRLLILRDSRENISRMLEKIAQVDLAEGKDDAAREEAPKPAALAPVPQPEVQTAGKAFSTFSLNVSDVSFKLAAASLEKGVMPEPAAVRSEEFINAFDYRDPEPPPGMPVAFAWERAQYPFAQNRDLLRFSIKTAALGRQPGRPLNIVLLLDNSGSMERADRVRIIHEALRVLAGQLQPQDKLSVVTFARTAHLWVDGVPGNQAAQVAEEVSGLTPEGGTNLEEAMNLAYRTALRHYMANGVNRVVLLTDGAANLGNVEPKALKQKVEANRKQGIALDCFGIGWEGYNDDLLEVLSRNGDGRYAFLNSPEEVASEFAAKLAGALQVAASDVKVQVEFNPARVTAYRQIGYAKHQLTKEQFRDNSVNAAQIGAAEAGNALYTVEVNPAGTGPLCTVRVRFRIPGTADYREHAWDVPFTGNAVPLEQTSPAMRLAATGSAFSEWLASSPYAGEVTPDRLLSYLSGVPEVYGADARPKKLEWMIRQAKSIAGK
jgi:Mg-chelatase subunit ChlD